MADGTSPPSPRAAPALSSEDGQHGTTPSPAAVAVRPAEAGDVRALFEFERTLYGSDSLPYFFLRQAVDALPGTFLVAVADGRPAGYALGSMQAGDAHAWILSIVVDPARQGRGIGRMLAAALVERFEARGATETWLHVSPSNAPAVALYESLGFAAVREEPHYFGPLEHRLIMRRPAPVC